MLASGIWRFLFLRLAETDQIGNLDGLVLCLINSLFAIAQLPYFFLLLTPHDNRALMENSKVINNPSFKTADVVSNGRVGQIASLTIIESNAVDDDEAMIIMGQRAAMWKSALPLTSGVIENQGVDFTIRSWQIGQCIVTDPNAIYVIDATQE